MDIQENRIGKTAVFVCQTILLLGTAVMPVQDEILAAEEMVR